MSDEREERKNVVNELRNWKVLVNDARQSPWLQNVRGDAQQKRQWVKGKIR